MGYRMLYVELIALREEGKEMSVETLNQLSEFNYEVEYTGLVPKDLHQRFSRKMYNRTVEQEIQTLQHKLPKTEEESEKIQRYFDYEYEHMRGFYYEHVVEVTDFIKRILEVSEEYPQIQVVVSQNSTSDEAFNWSMKFKGGKIQQERWGYSNEYKLLNYTEEGEEQDHVVYCEVDSDGNLTTEEVSKEEHKIREEAKTVTFKTTNDE